MSTVNAIEQLRRAAVTALSQLPEPALELGRLFADAGFELSLVGGSVRDAILDRPTADLDFATSARPEQTLELLSRWADAHWQVGIAYGTIGARKGAALIEVTTYRTEQYEGDSRKPQVAYGDSLDEDLYRRDFAVNAIAIRLPDAVFVDPYGGLTDLAAGVLRTPGPAAMSFGDDPLRMLRAARFAAQLGFRIDDDAFEAMRAMADRIAIVSAERIQAELTKLLLAPHPRGGLDALVDSGLAERILPELPAMRLEIDEHHRHKDVYQHSLTVLEQAIDLETDADGPVPGPDLTLRWAALLHDIGKPATRRFEPGGGVSFHHHELVGAKMAAKRLRALRYDKALIGDVARLIELHLRFHGYGDGAWTDSAVRRYVTDAGPLLERLHRLTRSDCTTRNKRKAARLSTAYDDLEERIARLQEQEELAAVRPELDGKHIMAILGVPPGPVVGRAYRFLLDLRLDRGLIGEDGAREALVHWWADQPESGKQ